jgi:hypothetical protein
MGYELIYGAGAAVLLAALIWGVLRYRQRTAREKQMGDDATRRLFQKQDRGL